MNKEKLLFDTSHSIEHILDERINEVEVICGTHTVMINQLQESLLKILNKISGFKSPYKCPACDGFGSFGLTEKTHKSPADHYRKENPCHSCEGKGIVWN